MELPSVFRYSAYCQYSAQFLADAIDNSTNRNIFNSRRTLAHHALVYYVPSREIANNWTQARRASTTTRLHHGTDRPADIRQGAGLSRLNRLWTSVGRFGANMVRCGLVKSDSCDCGAEQTLDHITSGRYPIYRSTGVIFGLIELDLNTRSWLEGTELGI